MNKLILVGNLTKNAVRNTVNAENDVLNFTVATNDGYTNDQGNWVDQVEYHSCSLFLKKGVGEKLEAGLVKGRSVELDGQLRSSKPNEAANGNIYHNKFVAVNDVRMGPPVKAKEDAPAAD